MNPIIVVSVSALVISVGAGWLLVRLLPTLKQSYVVTVSLCVACLILTVGAVLAPGILGRQLLIRDGQVIAQFDRFTSLWIWDSRWRGSSLESYEITTRRVAISTNPMTVNPEVLAMICEVDIEIGGTPEQYLQYRNSEWFRWPQAKLEYWMYEFRARLHGKLVAFSNPLEDKQQQEFEQLVREFLEPHFPGAGVRLKQARFRFPRPESRTARNELNSRDPRPVIGILFYPQKLADGLYTIAYVLPGGEAKVIQHKGGPDRDFVYFVDNFRVANMPQNSEIGGIFWVIESRPIL